MLSRMSPGVFASVFSAVYTYVAIADWTLFFYYPQINQITTAPLLDAAGKAVRSAGPSMHWYSWIVTALIPAIVIAFIVPRSATKSIERHLAWVPALIAVIAILIFERRWLTM